MYIADDIDEEAVPEGLAILFLRATEERTTPDRSVTFTNTRAAGADEDGSSYHPKGFNTGAGM